MVEPQTADDEISLLDIAVILAENWLLLIIVPLLATVIAGGLMWSVTPREYRSEALVRLNDEEATLVTSARILNPAILNSSYVDGYEGPLSRVRQNLVQQDLTITEQGETGLYRIGVRAQSPDVAQDLLQAIVNSMIENSTPSAGSRARLELELELAQTSVAELEAMLARLNRLADGTEVGTNGSAPTLGELGQSIVALLSNIETRRAEMLQIREELEGSISPEDVIQAPTVADAPQSRPVILRALLVGLGTGFVMLLIAFVRSGLQAARHNPASIEKLNRIRRAFWLKPVTLSDRS